MLANGAARLLYLRRHAAAVNIHPRSVKVQKPFRRSHLAPPWFQVQPFLQPAAGRARGAGCGAAMAKVKEFQKHILDDVDFKETIAGDYVCA